MKIPRELPRMGCPPQDSRNGLLIKTKQKLSFLRVIQLMTVNFLLILLFLCPKLSQHRSFTTCLSPIQQTLFVLGLEFTIKKMPGLRWCSHEEISLHRWTCPSAMLAVMSPCCQINSRLILRKHESWPDSFSPVLRALQFTAGFGLCRRITQLGPRSLLFRAVFVHMTGLAMAGCRCGTNCMRLQIWVLAPAKPSYLLGSMSFII